MTTVDKGVKNIAHRVTFPARVSIPLKSTLNRMLLILAKETIVHALMEYIKVLAALIWNIRDIFEC